MSELGERCVHQPQAFSKCSRHGSPSPGATAVHGVHAEISTPQSLPARLQYFQDSQSSEAAVGGWQIMLWLSKPPFVLCGISR